MPSCNGFPPFVVAKRAITPTDIGYCLLFNVYRLLVDVIVDVIVPLTFGFIYSRSKMLKQVLHFTR